MGEGGSAVALLASTTALLVYRPDTGARPEEAWRSLLAFSSTAALFACGFWATALYKVLHRNQFDLVSISSMGGALIPAAAAAMFCPRRVGQRRVGQAQGHPWVALWRLLLPRW